MERARANSQQQLSADIAARLAHEDKVQASAAPLPGVRWENGFSYTQANGGCPPFPDPISLFRREVMWQIADVESRE
jgi:hypothetical protein